MFGFKAISVHKIVSAVVAARDYSSNLILNLKGDYPFNGNRINVILDRSVNAATVSRAGDGNQQVSSFSPFSGGASYYFDGSGDYVTVPANSSLGFGTGNFTVEAFVLFPASGPNATIFSLGGSGNRFGLIIFPSNTLQVLDNGGQTILSDTSPFPTGRWVHVAFTRSSSTVRLFIDGVLKASGSNSTDYTSNPSGLIGVWLDGSNFVWSGYISNLRIVKGTALYTAAFTPSTTALTAVPGTSLLTCHNVRLFDASTNNFDLTVTGNTSASTFSPFDKTELSGSIGSTSVFFDGNGDYLSVPISTGFEFGTGDFTIEFWAYRTGAGGGDRFLVSRGNGANFLLRWNSAGVLQFFINSSLVNSYTYSFPINNWVHIAVARSGSTCKMFINGAEVSSVSNSANVSAAGNPVLIGGYTSVDFFQGYMSNVRIVKGTAVYTAAFTPPTSALSAVSGTSLLACDGAAITDSSSTNATITVAGDARLSALNPFGNGSGWSGYFDGTGDYLSVPSNAAFDFGTGDFTIECWAYRTEPAVVGTGIRVLVSCGTSKFLIRWMSGGALQFYLSDGVVNQATYSFPHNNWVHIAVARSGSTCKMFINGAEVSSASNSTNASSAGNAVLIGGDASGSFLGYISNVRIVKGTALYTSAFTPPTAAFTAISGTSLLTLQDSAFKDNSSNAFALTPTGEVNMRGVGPFAEPNVWSGFFDGTGDYLKVASNNAFDFGSGDLTIEAWIYPTSFGSGANIIGQPQNNVNASDGLTLYCSNTGVLGLYAAASTGGYAITSITTTISLNSWYHVAGTRNGNTWTLWVNGKSIGTATWAGTITQGSGNYGGIQIGSTINSSGNQTFFFTGHISNVRIVKGTALYTSTFTPSTSPLTAVAGTSLLTLQDNSFRDSSSNSFAITRSGDVIMRPHGPFAASYPASTTLLPGSVYFDGTNDYLTIPASAALNVLGGDFTIECWFNPISFNASNYNYLIMQDDGGSSSQNFQLTCSAAGLASFTTWNTSSRASSFGITSTRSVKLGAWNHIAVTHVKSTNTTRLFVNGRLEASSTTAIWAGSAQPTCIGNWTPGAGIQNSTYGKLNGHMAGVRLIKGSALYTAAFTPPTSPPIATADTALLLNFNDGGTVDAYGSSGSFFTANTGVVSNSSVKKSGTGSLYFPATYMVSAPHPDYALGTGDFTIEFWLNSTNASNSSRGILNISSTAPSSFGPTNEGVGIKFASSNLNGLINFFIGGSVQTGTINATNAAWTHVALCRSAGTVRLFVGGVLSQKVNSSANITGQYLTLGAGGDGLAYHMTGYLDNLAIYKGYAKYTADTTFTPV